MKPIVEYTDFRKFMLDFYEEQKLRHGFTWREFSKKAGFSSSSYMKVVCDGKSKLSRIGVERAGEAMGLVGFEMDYFRAMVKFGQEEDPAKKKLAYEEMVSIARLHKVRVIDSELFDFYESWKNPVLRELAPMMPEATRLAIRGMHYKMACLAANSLDLPKTERNFTGVTMGVSKESYEKIVKELDECRRKIIAIAADDANIDQVYRLNLQLFPLTKNAKEMDDEK